MPRSLLTTLVGVALLSLSCVQTLPGFGELPAVSTLAKPFAPAPTVRARSTDPALVAQIADRIRSQKRTSFTDAEALAVAHAVAGASRRHGVDPNLVLAVIHVESRFDAYAVSPVGAMGLMQILPSTGAELAERLGLPWRGPRTLFDPVANVELGIAYLDELVNRYDNTAMALAAYNWGPGRIDERLRLGAPVPTLYSGLVFKAYSTQRERRS